MDYVHEDLGTMAKELDRWQADYRLQADQLEKETKVSAEMTLPLQKQLRELDEKIADEHANTRAAKARILKQEQRIADLLRMVCTNRM